MAYSIGLYEKALPEDLSFEEKFRLAQKAGYDRLELSIDETDKKLARLEVFDYQSFLKLQEDYKIKVSTICLSGHRRFPLGSHIKETRDRSMDIMEKALIFSSRLGIEIIQLAGYDVYYNEESDEESLKYFTDNIFIASQMAQKYGIILGFETMENDFMNTIEKAMYFVDLVKSPYLKVYPDIGNITNGAKDVLYDLKRGEGHIVATHIKESKPNVFRDLRYGEGHVDFDLCLKELRRQGVKIFTAEFWYDKNRDYIKDLEYQIGFIKNILEA